MDSRYLRAFVTVAETGGISAAAERLGYAQSSLSAQLRRLEQELGVTVVVRTSAGASLTDAGRRLLPYAREALEVDERMRRAAAAARPRLRIGAPETLAGEWLPDIVTALGYGAGGPDADAEISVVVGPRELLAEQLAAGELDLAFHFDDGSPAPGPSAVVGHEEVVVVAGPAHPLAGADEVTEADVLAADFLVAEPGCSSTVLYDRLSRDLTGRVRAATAAGSLPALRRLAAHGRGLALLPRLAVVRDLEDGGLVDLPLASRPGPVAIEARWRPVPGSAEPTLRAVLRLARRHTDQLPVSPAPRPRRTPAPHRPPAPARTA
ncbi:LysR family transcriptional regulator [Streptomyces synnematoformans]|uniref:LysR family transcriptional regulator n=1 Tax=Streptomyces synnematoformans TaxID=415721 RepID=A0ABN1ZJW3_9ACTN